MEFDFIELLGYMATFFVAASFLFKSIIHLRVVNTIGAVLFVVYGLMKGAYPVAVLNAFLVFVNLYQLYRLKKEQPASKVLKDVYKRQGLESPTSGQIFIDGEDVTKSSIQNRDICIVFQSYACLLYTSRCV